ncbi:MAG TPA: hypothetical protein VFV18_05170 [Porticoccaceae bacterium]|nr:hypothetical protein [Porticoccaceae bacterium]
MTTRVSQQYPELLHYTTLEGLGGILSSGCIWATDAAYLNDSSEITHFFDERLRTLIARDARKYAIELARTPEYLEHMINAGGIDKLVDQETDAWYSVLRRVTLEMNRPFVLSLSGPSDARVQHSGLLSQWRGYGGGGGYALVLDTLELEAMLGVEAQSHLYAHVQIGDVYYHGIESKDQPAAPDIAEYEEIVRQGVSRMMRGGSAEETEQFYEAVTALSCMCKHWGFWEEREIRVVVVPASDEVSSAKGQKSPPRKEIKSFLRCEKYIPYVELFAPLGQTDERSKLPIKRVIVGPHKNREPHADSVRELLANNGYAAEVVQSEIPYIGR